MPGNPITIRNLGPEDAHVLDRIRPGTFDGDLDPARAWAFLATRVNEMVVALDHGEVVGLAFGTTHLSPTGATRFFVNEIRVHEAYRRRGIGRRMLNKLSERAMDRGCEGLWVLANGDTDSGREVYGRLGGTPTGGVEVFEWTL